MIKPLLHLTYLSIMVLVQIDEVQGNRKADASSTCKTKICSVYRIHENLREHLIPQIAICTSTIMGEMENVT